MQDRQPKRRRQQYQGPPVTMGHIRSHGVRRLLIYCTQGLYCHHSAVIDAERWPDETVLLDLDHRPSASRTMIGRSPTATSLRAGSICRQQRARSRRSGFSCCTKNSGDCGVTAGSGRDLQACGC
jgi:hypothetical protein